MDLVPGTELWLVRHGRTEWAATGRHTGRTDIPLDAVGVAQAKSLREPLARIQPAVVVSSPLQRARRTCELAGFGESCIVDDDLQEWDYGDYEGWTRPQINAAQADWSVWTHGAPSGESSDDVSARISRTLERHVVPGSAVLMFAHGHLLRALAGVWVGLGVGGGRLFNLDPAAVSVLGSDRGTPVIKRWNQPPTP